MTQRALLVGLGSDFGDDQAGLLVAQRLQSTLTRVAVRPLRSPAALLDLLDGLDALYIIDACCGAGEPGTILRCDWPMPALTSLRFTGTHDLDLPGALHLANELGLLPARVTVWAIEVGEQARPIMNQLLSAPVVMAIDRLVAEVTAEPQIEAQHA